MGSQVGRNKDWTDCRFLNMFSALEALLTLGKCRELPVVGFVNGVLIMGVIVSPPCIRAETRMRSLESLWRRRLSLLRDPKRPSCRSFLRQLDLKSELGRTDCSYPIPRPVLRGQSHRRATHWQAGSK